jgi:hypothetical protein
MTIAALFLVAPLALLAAALMLHGSPEAVWARKGLVAGLAAVTAYDALRIPVSFTGLWSDFIPRLGGWVIGTNDDQLLVGYLWRYIGDGGGIGMAFFVFCGVVASVRPSLITTHPMLLSLGYGVFIWLGLVLTVVLTPHGAEMLFPMTQAKFFLSLLGHLVYSAVLGAFLPKAMAPLTTPAVPQKSDARSKTPRFFPATAYMPPLATGLKRT